VSGIIHLMPSPVSVVDLIGKLLVVDPTMSAPDRAEVLSRLGMSPFGTDGGPSHGYTSTRLSTPLAGVVDGSAMESDGTLVLVSLSGMYRSVKGNHIDEGFAALHSSLVAAFGTPRDSTGESAVWNTGNRTVELLAFFDAAPGVSVTISYPSGNAAEAGRVGLAR
jgi:hypothetical protein